MSVETAVVLAAGEGTRLRPLTRNRPKPMLPAANRPILEYVLDALIAADVTEICLVVGFRRDRVQEHFGPTYRGVDLTYVHQEKQLGSGHALLQAREAVGGSVLALNGDRVIDPGIVEDVTRAFGETGEPTLAVLDHPTAHRYGAVQLDGDRVTQIVEKPPAGAYRLINAGVYAFERDVFGAIESTPRREGELQLTDTIERHVSGSRPVHGVRTDGLWVDATYPWDLLEVARQLLEEGWVETSAVEQGVGDALETWDGDAVEDGDGDAVEDGDGDAVEDGDGDAVEGTGPDGGTFVANSALVHEAATLQPPVAVGPDSEIAAGAVVGPAAAVGRNVTVGANATVARSVLDADTRVGSGSTLLDCVTGQDVELGAGTLVPGGPADVRVGDRVFEGQRLGAVLADRVRAAGGVTAAAGTLVGPNARLQAGVRVEGQVPEDAEVVR